MLVNLAGTPTLLSSVLVSTVVAYGLVYSSGQLCAVVLVIVLVLAATLMRAFFFICRWVGVLGAVSGTEHLLIVQVQGLTTARLRVEQYRFIDTVCNFIKFVLVSLTEPRRSSQSRVSFVAPVGLRCSHD